MKSYVYNFHTINQNPKADFGKIFFLVLVFKLFLWSPAYAAKNHQLISHKVNSAPKLDGDSSDSQWEGAKELKVISVDGPEITLKSVYTGQEIYFLLQWKDLTESIRPDLWVFNDKKWSVLQEKRWEDEEPWEADNDMIGMHWPIKDSVKGFEVKGCLKLCHAPETEDKMYTNGPNERTDIWLWKAGMTNPLGYADSYSLDNTNGSKKDEKDRVKRINAAHKSDDLGPGNRNYVRNENDGKPMLMPDKEVNNYPFLFKGDEIKFDQSRFKNGDTLPGWVLDRPEGSRGFINAKGAYNAKEGKWVLELNRELVTDDEDHDVQFTDLNKVYYFGLAVWDNDKFIAHTRVKKPIELLFK